jgi:hypothetical protein
MLPDGDPGFTGAAHSDAELLARAEAALFFDGTGEHPEAGANLAAIALPNLIKKREIVAEPRSDLVAKYNAFDEYFGPVTGIVYHPSCANDSSPSEVFAGADNRVVYVDLSNDSVIALQQAGLEAHAADANTFNPGPVDLLILLNPAIGNENVAAHVKPGSYVLANDYHANASDFYHSDEYELMGIIHDRTEGDKAIVDTENPEQYWELAETDEEFRASAEYLAISKMTEMATGIKNISLTEYKVLIEKIKTEHTDAHEMDGCLMWTEDGMSKIMFVGMPRKKGHQDDFFVFRKK